MSQDGCLVTRLEEERLDLVVEYEYESATSSSEDVGEGTLEERAGTLSGVDLSPAVHGAGVCPLGDRSTGLHHHTPSHGVEGVGHDTGHSGHHLDTTNYLCYSTFK